MTRPPPLQQQDSLVAEEILGHKLGDSASRDEVKKIIEEVIVDRNAIRAAQKKITFQHRALVLGAVGVVLAFGACVAAVALGVEVTRDTKHSHESGTESGTRSLLDVNGDAITTSLTTFESAGDAGACALLLPPVGDAAADAGALGSALDLLIPYQGETAEKLLHLRIGSIEYGVPDDPDDGEAIVGEVASVSGRYAVGLRQDGSVVVVKDDEVFATDVVCDVEALARRRLRRGRGRGRVMVRSRGRSFQVVAT